MRRDFRTTVAIALTRIGPSSTGRARDIWNKLQLVANILRNDSTAAHVRTDSRLGARR